MPWGRPHPVKDFFIYIPETGKSRCKECLADLAGEHTENLKRHLRRKHPQKYEEFEMVLLQQKTLRQLHLARDPPVTRSSRKKLGFKTPKKAVIPKSKAPDVKNQSPETPDVKVQLPEPSDVENQLPEPSDVKVELPEPSDVENQLPGPSNVKYQLPESTNSKPPLQKQIFDYLQLIPVTRPLSLEQMTPKQSAAEAVTSITPPSNASDKKFNVSTTAPIPESGNVPFYVQYLVHKFNELSNKSRNRAQYEISKILYKADMGCFDQDDSS